MKRLILTSLIVTAAFAAASNPIDSLVKASPDTKFSVMHTEDQWKGMLSKNAFLVLRKSATEKPYSGKFWDFHETGVFECAGCGQVVFSSKNKFDSHTGWPSFYKEIARGRTLTRLDTSEGEPRTEIICARCGGHLGHVFDDGPEPTHLRYCMNSPALKFVKGN